MVIMCFIVKFSVLEMKGGNTRMPACLNRFILDRFTYMSPPFSSPPVFQIGYQMCSVLLSSGDMNFLEFFPQLYYIYNYKVKTEKTVFQNLVGCKIKYCMRIS